MPQSVKLTAASDDTNHTKNFGVAIHTSHRSISDKAGRIHKGEFHLHTFPARDVPFCHKWLEVMFEIDVGWIYCRVASAGELIETLKPVNIFTIPNFESEPNT